MLKERNLESSQLILANRSHELVSLLHQLKCHNKSSKKMAISPFIWYRSWAKIKNFQTFIGFLLHRLKSHVIGVLLPKKHRHVI